MKQQLWILNHYAQPPDMPGGTRHYELGRQLVELGYDVTIFASSFRHSQRQETRRYGPGSSQVEEIDGLRFVWLRTFAYTKNDWRRLLNMASYMVLAYAWGRWLAGPQRQIPRPTVIIGSSVHLLAVLAADFLARRFGAHFVMEVRDLWPQTLVEMGGLAEGSLLTRMLRRLEKYLYGRAEQIVVLPPQAAEYIAGLGIDTHKVHWIPNGVNLTEFPVRTPESSADGTFVVMYVGAHGQANALDVILDAAHVIQCLGPSDIRFVFVGDGPEKPRLMARGDRLGLTNIEFRDAVPKYQVPATLRTADLFVVGMRDLALYRYGVSPNKLFEYMASARPIVLAGEPCNDTVQEAGCGLSVPAGDPGGLAAAILQIRQLPREEREAMGQGGRAFVEEHHNYARLAQQLADLLEDLDHDGEAAR